MIIVKATNPPTMVVTVDTILYGEVDLYLGASHATKRRIDIVYSTKGTVGIMKGTPANSPIAPILASTMRPLAEVIIYPAVSYICQENIKEL